MYGHYPPAKAHLHAKFHLQGFVVSVQVCGEKYRIIQPLTDLHT